MKGKVRMMSGGAQKTYHNFSILFEGILNY